MYTRRPAHRPQNETRPERAMRASLSRAGIAFIQEYTGFTVLQPDFYLPERRLVIEVDGTYWHNTPRQRRRDFIKDKTYHLLGLTVLRFSDREVFADPEGCVRRVLEVGT